MLLRKYMSLLGIGAAKIDLILHGETFSAGEEVTGHFHIQGGTIDQRVKRIECDLVMTDESQEETIETFTIYTSKRIDSEESNQMEFQFTLPQSLKPSSKVRTYRFKTKMIFAEGIKSEDQDRIIIV